MRIGKAFASRMELCRQCLGLRGPIFDTFNGCERIQRCRCEAKEPLWNAYDYNSAAALCECCAWRVLPSGSKWSIFFCEPCKRPIVAHNKAVGVAVIPIGRHSLMNEFALPVNNLQNRLARREFARKLPGLFERMVRLGGYHHAHVAHIVASIDIPGPTVPLSLYIEHARRGRLPTSAAFADVLRGVLTEGARPWWSAGSSSA